jgi:WD40 repeat protein
MAALGTQDGSIRLWTINKEAKGERVPGGDWPAMPTLGDVIFTPDSKLVLTGGAEDGEVKIWDWKKREALKTFKAHDKGLSAFAMSPDGSRFATTGADNTVKLWETATGKELRRWAMGVPVSSLAFTPDGKQVVTANDNCTLYVLELP